MNGFFCRWDIGNADRQSGYRLQLHRLERMRFNGCVAGSVLRHDGCHENRSGHVFRHSGRVDDHKKWYWWGNRGQHDSGRANQLRVYLSSRFRPRNNRYTGSHAGWMVNVHRLERRRVRGHRQLRRDDGCRENRNGDVFHHSGRVDDHKKWYWKLSQK